MYTTGEEPARCADEEPVADGHQGPEGQEAQPVCSTDTTEDQKHDDEDE